MTIQEPPAVAFAVMDDDAIWGNGPTPETAWIDWAEWVDPPPPHSKREDFKCVPITAALLAELDERGGDIVWETLPSGTVCTVEEYSAWAEV
jgi:hypothetical protein